MAHSKGKKAAREEVAEKDDLYHDIKHEKKKKLKKKEYEKLLLKLEIELVKLQEWVKAKT